MTVAARWEMTTRYRGTNTGNLWVWGSALLKSEIKVIPFLTGSVLELVIVKQWANLQLKSYHYEWGSTDCTDKNVPSTYEWNIMLILINLGAWDSQDQITATSVKLNEITQKNVFRQNSFGAMPAGRKLQEFVVKAYKTYSSSSSLCWADCWMKWIPLGYFFFSVTKSLLFLPPTAFFAVENKQQNQRGQTSVWWQWDDLEITHGWSPPFLDFVFPLSLLALGSLCVCLTQKT